MILLLDNFYMAEILAMPENFHPCISYIYAKTFSHHKMKIRGFKVKCVGSDLTKYVKLFRPTLEKV